MEDNMSALLPMAREIAAKAYRTGSVVYRGIIGGQWDHGEVVQSAVRGLVNAGGHYPKLPEEQEPERPINTIDDE